MVLLFDNYDSFTYNLRDYIQQLGLNCIVVRNDEMSAEQIEQLQFDSIVISPGPKTPKEAGLTMWLTEKFYREKPILGICLGHQAIGEFFGGRLVKAAKPMHGKTSQVRHNNHFIFEGIDNPFEVMRYHSLILEEVTASGLDVIASTTESEVMAIAHSKYRIAGLQFHPESILTPYGLQILRNWFNNNR